MSVIVIGDVHGCIKTLEALLAKLPKGPQIVFVGDLIDRGSGSKQVIELVSNSYKSVLGNHEQMAISACYGGRSECMDWTYNGGDKCLESYGSSWPPNNDFKAHVAWMESLPLFLEFPDVKDAKGRHLLVTHSSAHSVWKKGPDSPWFREALLWNRLPNIKPIRNIYSVFGHTPQKNGPRIRTFYANIDTGCCFAGSPGYGSLTALQFPEMTVYSQENLDMADKS